MGIKERAIALLFLLIVLIGISPACFAVITNASMPVFAVVSGEEKAIKATLYIEIEPGDGSIYSKVGPLVGTSTQNTEKISVELARDYFERVDEYDYKFSIESDASIVDGPSAGAAMALLLVSMLQDKELPDYISVTGTINSDGTVGPVGGVFVKADGASEAGIKLFLIPEGEALQTHKIEDEIKTVDLTQYGWQEWGIKVIEVQTLDDLLEYAFTDVEEIDVEKIAKERAPLFIPEGIPLNRKLRIMKDFTKEYLQEASNKINAAKGSLANTILNNTTIENTLYNSIAQAEQTLDEARALFDQNYLYSAANYAFLSIINASMVEDISANPSLLVTQSSLFSQKLSELEKEAKELEKQFNSIVPAEMIEWNLAAKHRLAWAKLKILKIKERQQILVSGLEEVITAVDNLREYEFARAWMEVAKSFHEFSSQTNKFVEIKELFKETAEENIVKAEDALTALELEDKEDVTRRLQGAYIEKQNEWFLAAAVDAASAHYLALAEKEIQRKNLEELIELAEGKISSLNERIAESGKEFVWSQMYLDHGNYFFKAAEFYRDHDSVVKAKQNAENAVSLVMFAEGIFEVMNPAYNEIAGLEVIEGIRKKEIPKEEKEGEEIDEEKKRKEGRIVSIPTVNALLLGILVMLIIIFLILLAYFFRTSSVSFRELSQKASASKKTEEIERIEKGIDKALIEGKISEKKHNELIAKYKEKAKELRKKREKESIHLIELDKLETQLKAGKYLLRKIERQHKLKRIRKKDFLEVKKQVENELISLKEQIKNKKLALLQDEEEIENIKIKKLKIEKKGKKVKKRAGKK